MKRSVIVLTLWLASLLAAAILAGCAGLQAPPPRVALRAAADTYGVTLGLLAEYRSMGLIDDAAADRIERVRIPARMALNAWRACIQKGRSPAEAIEEFHRHMTILLTERLAVERDEGRTLLWP